MNSSAVQGRMTNATIAIAATVAVLLALAAFIALRPVGAADPLPLPGQGTGGVSASSVESSPRVPSLADNPGYGAPGDLLPSRSK